MHNLFIDDHKDSADAFGEIASGLGHKVQVAYDGRSAMALTQTQSFDVVFSTSSYPTPMAGSYAGGYATKARPATRV